MYVKYHILHMDWARTLIPLDNWCCWNTRGAGPCWLRSQVQEVQKLQAGVQADQKLPISGGKKQAPKKKKCVSAPARTLLHSMRSIWRTIVFFIINYDVSFSHLKANACIPRSSKGWGQSHSPEAAALTAPQHTYLLHLCSEATLPPLLFTLHSWVITNCWRCEVWGRHLEHISADESHWLLLMHIVEWLTSWLPAPSDAENAPPTYKLWPH